MKKYWLFWMAILSLFGLFSCEKTREIPDISHIPPVEVEVVRLDRELNRAQSHEEIAAVLDKYPEFAEQYFRRSRYPHDTLLTAQILAFNQDRYTDTLLTDIDRIFGDMSEIKQEFAEAFRFGQHYFPDMKPQRIFTLASGFSNFGFGSDIFVSEEIIVVGLDYFSGPTATYRPKDIPNYLMRRYAPEYIVPAALTFISTKYNAYKAEDQTLVADMMFYGKSYAFVSHLMPHTADSVIIGYSAEEMELSEGYQELIWARIIEKNVLFETSNDTKNRYLGERPNVTEIADKCPGRIGRWLGWQVVQRYLETHPEVTFPALMQMPDAQQIFRESKYKPRASS